jgi:pimeloyl-ACP methyl ester carboxylesterase
MRTRPAPARLVTVVLTLLVVACALPPASTPAATSADGLTIRYEEHGNGEPALVFVHGWSCDRSYWDAQVPYFSDRYRVVTVDLGGHGESGLEREVWSIEAFGQDVAAVVEQLDLHDVVLVGHSMGGPVTVEAALLLGDRAVGIIGVDTFHDLSERWSEEAVEAWMQPFRDDYAARARTLVPTMFAPGSDSAFVARITADMASAPPAVGTGAMMAYNVWWNAKADTSLPALSMPVRALNADLYPTDVEAGRAYVPSFDAVIMPGVGHFLMMEDPETFNGLLEGILEDLPRAAEPASGT